jgi:hypothetical protein
MRRGGHRCAVRPRPRASAAVRADAAVRFMRTFVFSGVLIGLLQGPAAAQQMQGCEDHDQIVQRLRTKFHEERAEVGVNQYGWLIELFESADGKTWTLAATRPGGPTCVFGIGSDWQTVTPVEGDPS